MESITENRRTTRGKRSHLAAALGDPESLIHRAKVNVGGKYPLLETKLLEPVVTTSEEKDPSFMERVTAENTVTNEKMTQSVL